MQEIALVRGGFCISTQYINTDTKLLWQCYKLHQWEATPYHIKNRKSWCPLCAKNAKLDIETCRDLATERDGKCLSESYTNNQTKLKWQCISKHTWEASLSSIKGGQWCPDCSGSRKASVDSIKDIIKNKGGEYLSHNGNNARDRFEVKCDQDHIWNPTKSALLNGNWCPHCAKCARHDISFLRKTAKERGGKLLSSKYTNNRDKLDWRCAEGHEWNSRVSSILTGTWCPSCSSGLGERITREFFEQIFNHSFPKSYPQWLVNGKGNRCELDGYSKAISLAFEHQGDQHYSIVYPFVKNQEELTQRRLDDKDKNLSCKNNGVLLISVPSVPSRLKISELKKYIYEQCNLNNFKVPNNFHEIDVDHNKAYSTPNSSIEFEAIIRKAESHGGECLSRLFVSAKSKLDFICAKGHEWSATADSVKRGSWCLECGKVKAANSRRTSIGVIKELAKQKNGECLTEEYEFHEQKLLWRCEKGHQWKTTYSNVRSGSWCHQCAGNTKKSLQDLVAIATSKGGTCLTKHYENNKTRVELRCKNGHEWETGAKNIFRGDWCGRCQKIINEQKIRNKNFENAREIASQRNGLCLSKEYLGNHEKLTWMCQEKHQWDASYYSVKAGAWCGKCSAITAGSKRKLTIRDMQQLAQLKNGVCLSTKYINARTHLTWQCEKKHVWEAVPYNIKSGRWCPACAGRNKGR